MGGDLKSLLTQDLRLPETSVHDFGRDLLSALQHLHSNSIIHCDLKPSNIMMDENGWIKLGGFSVARKLSSINSVPLSELQAVLSPSALPTALMVALCELRSADRHRLHVHHPREIGSY